jgi:predicted house-cleaning NTP pyrophosphatase (Maf/HAM1 superfamily)
VVLTHAQPITSDTAYSVLPRVNQELLEKPESKADNLRMLLGLNGGGCEVVTGLVVGELLSATERFLVKARPAVFPVLTSPSYIIK